MEQRFKIIRGKEDQDLPAGQAESEEAAKKKGDQTINRAHATGPVWLRTDSQRF